MPAVSQAQRRAMFAAAAGNSTLGIPKKVGKEFADADRGGKLPARAKPAKNTSRNDHMTARKQNGVTHTEIGKEFGKHRTTVSRAIKRGYLKVGDTTTDPTPKKTFRAGASDNKGYVRNEDNEN